MRYLLCCLEVLEIAVGLRNITMYERRLSSAMNEEIVQKLVLYMVVSL